jgi:hypothetical protein
MMTQIAYTAIALATLVTLAALPVGATTRQGCDDVTNPLCVPFGATDEQQEGDTIRGSGRAKVLPQ